MILSEPPHASSVLRIAWELSITAIRSRSLRRGISGLSSTIWAPRCQPYYTTLGPGQTTKLEDDSRNLRCIQFLHTHPKHRETLQEENPHIPHLGKVSIPTDWKEQRILPFQIPIRIPAPREPAARTPHNTSLMRSKPKNPPVSKPKPSIGILETPSISIPQQATNHPSKSGFPKVTMPKFPWGCSRRPPPRKVTRPAVSRLRD